VEVDVGSLRLQDGEACVGDPLEECPQVVAKSVERLPEELATTVEVVARGRGISVNTLVVDAPTAEVERVRHDEEFMGKLREITERDREILDRLAQ